MRQRSACTCPGFNDLGEWVLAADCPEHDDGHAPGSDPVVLALPFVMYEGDDE